MGPGKSFYLERLTTPKSIKKNFIFLFFLTERRKHSEVRADHSRVRTSPERSKDSSRGRSNHRRDNHSGEGSKESSGRTDRPRSNNSSDSKESSGGKSDHKKNFDSSDKQKASSRSKSHHMQNNVATDGLKNSPDRKSPNSTDQLRHTFDQEKRADCPLRSEESKEGRKLVRESRREKFSSSQGEKEKSKRTKSVEKRVCDVNAETDDQSFHKDTSDSKVRRDNECGTVELGNGSEEPDLQETTLPKNIATRSKINMDEYLKRKMGKGEEKGNNGNSKFDTKSPLEALYPETSRFEPSRRKLGKICVYFYSLFIYLFQNKKKIYRQDFIKKMCLLLLEVLNVLSS